MILVEVVLLDTTTCNEANTQKEAGTDSLQASQLNEMTLTTLARGLFQGNTKVMLLAMFFTVCDPVQ